MTKQEKISTLKTLLGISDTADDTLLTVYLSLAANSILRKAYPFDDTKTEVPAKYEMTQLNIAVYLYNKRGAEGEIAHNENGISRSYENADIPTSLLDGVIPYVAVLGSKE